MSETAESDIRGILLNLTGKYASREVRRIGTVSVTAHRLLRNPSWQRLQELARIRRNEAKAQRVMVKRISIAAEDAWRLGQVSRAVMGRARRSGQKNRIADRRMLVAYSPR